MPMECNAKLLAGMVVGGSVILLRAGAQLAVTCLVQAQNQTGEFISPATLGCSALQAPVGESLAIAAGVSVMGVGLFYCAEKVMCCCKKESIGSSYSELGNAP